MSASVLIEAVEAERLRRGVVVAAAFGDVQVADVFDGRDDGGPDGGQVGRPAAGPSGPVHVPRVVPASTTWGTCRVSHSQRGHGMSVGVPFFEHEPTVCPFGHELRLGWIQIGWRPCTCQAAREAAERGRGLGHGRLNCRACDLEGRFGDLLRTAARHEAMACEIKTAPALRPPRPMT
jgi:hypothetical protein